MYNPSFSLEESYEGLVAGIDEAGCGAWAGPVIAAAVIFLDRKKLNIFYLTSMIQRNSAKRGFTPMRYLIKKAVF